MSSDEFDTAPGQTKRYLVLKKLWRHPSLTAWLMVFNKLYARVRMNVTQGSRPRAPSDRSLSSPAVRGLPENAYNPDWLHDRTQYQKMLLQVQTVQYDFTHTPEIQVIA